MLGKILVILVTTEQLCECQTAIWRCQDNEKMETTLSVFLFKVASEVSVKILSTLCTLERPEYQYYFNYLDSHRNLLLKHLKHQVNFDMIPVKFKSNFSTVEIKSLQDKCI